MENQEIIEKNRILKKFNVTQNENETNETLLSKKLCSPKKFRTKDSQIKFITKKNFYFRIEDTNECKKKSIDNIVANEGRWSKEEHGKFLEGIVLYGINWKKVKTLIGTRTSIQVRSHAQKFFYKMKTCKDETLGIDFTLNSICNIRDMISQIKNQNTNYNIINVFKYLTYKCDNLEKSRKKIIVKNNKSFDFKKNEQNYQTNFQPNIISLKENSPNMNDNDFFFNQNNNFNEQNTIKEAQNFYNNNTNNLLKINNQNNIINILQNLLTMNYYSNAYNFLLSNNAHNVNSPNYDITNSVNKLLINYLISNNSLNNSNLLNENVLLSLALQNNILNNINNINFIHNINNNNNLNDINYKNNINDINNYNAINNLNNENENNIDKMENDLFDYIDKKNNIEEKDNNNDNDDNEDNKDNKVNKDNKDDNIDISNKDLFFINIKKNNSKNEEDSLNNNYPSQKILA